MSRSIRKESSSLAFGMVGRFGGSSAGFVVAALNAASAASRELVVLRVLSAGILSSPRASHPYTKTGYGDDKSRSEQMSSALPESGPSSTRFSMRVNECKP